MDTHEQTGPAPHVAEHKPTKEAGSDAVVAASTEPAQKGTAMASTSRRTPSRSTSPRLTRSATTPILSTSQSLSVSPLPSRETSPIRPLQPPTKYSTARVSRSRKNSSEQSPQRTPSHTPTTAQSVPSAAAVQRALAAVGDKKLASPTTTHFAPDSLEPRKTARAPGQGAAASRLTSPPSIPRLKTVSTRTPEQQANPIAHNTSKPPSAIETIQEEDDADSPAVEPRYTGRGNAGSKLETVQEDSPTGVRSLSDNMSAVRPSTIQEDPDEDNPSMTSSATTAGTKSSTTTAENGSGSDDAMANKDKGKELAKGKEPEKPSEAQKTAQSPAASRKPSTTQLAPTKPPAVQPRRSFQHLNPARNKEGSVKSMTVETETVSNPDLLGDREGRNANGRLDGGGSVRTKASTETIRPRREKKRVRKAPSIASGTASSKADIFEAKVASAVDEAANSSDSDETFVYESNPPEPRSAHRNQHGQRYHHSRTPSVASMASQSTDNYRSNHFGISGKKSMKFVNANQLRDPDDEDAAYYPSNTSRSSHRHHHHLARLTRLQNQSNDSDAPVTSARSPRRPYNSWRTQGHRTPQEDGLVAAMGDKSQNASMYDFSHGAEADDEYTPLIRSGRNDPRLRRGRLSRTDSYRRSPLRSCVSCAKYTCISMLMGTVVALVVIALVLCNRELFDGHVVAVRNVLSSEQELFLELVVSARNPNLVDISIAEGDLDLFAKSKYVGTTEMWRDGTIPGLEDEPYHNRSRTLQIMPRDNVDDGTDPIEEPGSGTHTMLLGRVTDFDSPLVFESSPFNHELRRSVATLRLAKPGNKTEEGGSRRWENVMQHPFELVVRGRGRYYLPLSSRKHPFPVSASTTVSPDKPIDDDNPKGNDTVKITTKRNNEDALLKKQWRA